MEVEGLPLDRISTLPPNIIQHILTLMPLRDAFKTSILSQNWRYHCRYIPKLWFDIFGPYDKTSSNKCTKLHSVVYPILLLHRGPILKFTLNLYGLNSCCEIDQIILYMSRNPALKEFKLWINLGDEHKLLPAFFELQQLTVLELRNCAFQPPVTFKGFSRLVKLHFSNVSIAAKDFLRIISNCSLLKDLTLFLQIGNEEHLLGSWNSNFIELFERLPLLEHLRLSSYPIQCFATGGVPEKLPTSLVHLKSLEFRGFALCFGREVDLRLIILFVTSSPNIETIHMEMEAIELYPTEAVSQTTMNFFDHQDYSYVVLNRLRTLVIFNFSNMKTGMDFVKLILAKSPMLKKVLIHIDELVDIHGRVKILTEMIRYPRASAKAEIKVY